ncbi:LOW QUALITY PROTEIN: uncharacterized protein LOC107309905 [Coturnix japonica]|uniref:LOW QUALITY PROTEIN: uncharacterized protein LOC107309905 n=1 Tax=Coturnix japonica TaxID=93934 RepID=UPI000777F9E5|nr:LOW QUALITY PROTEIN: uncharacterized protein LOC107309905 [Coturnix japonica]
MLMFVCIVCLFWSPVGGIHLLKQPGNLWVTWANHTGTSEFCLALQSATSPFQTCLIGVPEWDDSAFEGYLGEEGGCLRFCSGLERTWRWLGNDSVYYLGKKMACTICRLNIALPEEPQQLDLLGSQMVPNDTWDKNSSRWLSPGCMIFGSMKRLSLTRQQLLGPEGPYWDPKTNQTIPYTLVYPCDEKTFDIDGGYCGFYPNGSVPYRSGDCPINISIGGVVNISRTDGSVRGVDCEDMSFNRGCCVFPIPKGSFSFMGELWNNGTAKALPPGVFLICGDRAWQGIPRNPIGGPCYLGKLTILSPSISEIYKAFNHSRAKRDIHVLESDCGDNVRLWGPTARIFTSFFTPGVAAAHALKEIERLACWTVKQANVTSQLLSDLLIDVESIRHAVLQNRAAIDFLLLAQGHGCQDVEGMCCFNLSDHSESLHKKLAWLQDHTKKIGVVDDPFGDWLGSLFGNIGPWFKQLLKVLVVGLIVLLALLICTPCIIQCLQGFMHYMVTGIFEEKMEQQRAYERL